MTLGAGAFITYYTTHKGLSYSDSGYVRKCLISPSQLQPRRVSKLRCRLTSGRSLIMLFQAVQSEAQAGYAVVGGSIAERLRPSPMRMKSNRQTLIMTDDKNCPTPSNGRIHPAFAVQLIRRRIAVSGP